MPKVDHIFLDVDGVLADYTRAALRVHDAEHLLTDWPRGERDLPTVLGISRTQFWQKIDDRGASFWEGLEPYPWFSEVIAYVASVAPFTLLTASTLSPECASGKVKWIYHWFPKQKGKRFTNFLIGHQKGLLAAPRRVLIDDAEHYITSFEQAGGTGILFPQVWNRHHSIADPSAFLRDSIDKYRNGDAEVPDTLAPSRRPG